MDTFVVIVTCSVIMIITFVVMTRIYSTLLSKGLRELTKDFPVRIAIQEVDARPQGLEHSPVEGLSADVPAMVVLKKGDVGFVSQFRIDPDGEIKGPSFLKLTLV